MIQIQDRKNKIGARYLTIYSNIKKKKVISYSNQYRKKIWLVSNYSQSYQIKNR